MFLRAYRRSRLRRFAYLLLLIAVILCILDYISLATQYSIFQENIASSTVDQRSELPSAVRGESIFICAQFWTSQAVLRAFWSESLFYLVLALGVENVYISVYESGSLDGTKTELSWLDYKLDELGVKRTIILDPTTHADELSKVPGVNGTSEEGWIHTPRSGERKELRRIPFLANLRNKALEPLWNDPRIAGTTFDRILWLNDFMFKPSDVLTLLATRGGAYSVACAIDFKDPAKTYYDTFVLRDSDGQATVMNTFPYFRSAASREQLLRGLPVPVTSCWNGMVVMDAGPFYGTDLDDPSATPSDSESASSLLPLANATSRLYYRGIPDSLAQYHLEGSECCLINTDLAARYSSSSSPSASWPGIYVNPAVRVGYSPAAYLSVHAGPDSGQDYVTLHEYVRGVYRNRWERWTRSYAWETKHIRRRFRTWMDEQEHQAVDDDGSEGVETRASDSQRQRHRTETGEICLIDEMHVLTWNGWAHV